MYSLVKTSTSLNNQTKGFTLIEVMVSVTIFSMVMIVATGAVFAVVNANKKTHSIKSVMTNLNFALDSMIRDIRVGSTYSCNDLGNCTDGNGTKFSFTANRDVNNDGYPNVASPSPDIVEYSVVSGRIQRVITSNGTYTSFITAPEVVIDNLVFYVTGSGPGNGQAKVLISIRGYSGVGQTQSNFNIQTTISQRSIDT